MASHSSTNEADEFTQLSFLSNPSNLPPPTPVPKLDRSQVLAQHQALIERERAWSQSSSTETRQRKEVVGPYKPWSRRTGSRNLEFVEGLHKLRCDESAKGKALLVRIISATVVNAISVHCVIEDNLGDVAPVQLYRLPRNTSLQDLNDRFPQRSTFVISEPTLRSSKGGFLIRIDSPADFYGCLDPLNVQTIPFRNEKQNISTPQEHALAAETYLEQGRLQAGLRSCALAIDRAWNTGKDELLASLGYLQSRAFYEVGQYRSCLDGTEGAFETASNWPQATDPKGQIAKKALWLGAKAAYRIQEWDHARGNLADLKRLQKLDGEMIELECKIGKRIEENREGSFEWEGLFDSAKEGKDFEVSDYRHPSIEVREIEGKGAGVVAKSRIERGELILFEEALASAESTSLLQGHGGGSSTICVNLFTKEYDPEALGQTVSILLEKMSGDEKVKKLVYDLSTGPAEGVLDELKVDRVKVEEDEVYDYDEEEDDPDAGPPGLDVSRVEAIVTYNSFKVRCITAQASAFDPTAKNQPKTDRLAIYNFASRFNHSCLSNVSYQFVGDRILVRAIKTIEEGEEVVLSYTDSMRGFEERRMHQEKHGFECGCRLCALDAGEGSKQREERRSLIKRLEEMDENESDDLDAYLDLLRQIDGTYATDRPTSIRPESFRPLTIFAERLARASQLAQAIEMQKKALEAVGASFASSTEVVNSFPILGDEESVKVALRIADKYRAMGDRAKVGVWVGNAKRLEEGESGGVLMGRRYKDWVGDMGMKLDLR
ncbi:BZ3500_MvSof-1268-A1-R1_Chr3-3g06531 [Microbotryum saponariae]|uniref:BZ3500_MvSof-1268-A1-R1_Chr3-3g06531 protein n=1 Tax=Microbotryum saponariae TaxID=289078 RepID=A0A2X0LHK4_9BASI|nr:BZ3500_MvSof-1268-A1-R1_Chr3-3g06531 [Microbotryum saponariae]SDA04498.1 BZ3501_MvSof-1269-A2-R1_Chr3-2g06218 [Microbotryum saponariae]